MINTDENPEYVKPSGVIQVDSYTGITLKEQSLVMSFEKNTECNDENCNPGGIDENSIFAIEKNLSTLSGDNAKSFFVYNNLEMYVFGGDPAKPGEWSENGDAELLFRIGRDENFYEIRQPIYPEWDIRNHIDINIDYLSSKKLEIHPLETFEDTGKDELVDAGEDGCGGALKFVQMLIIHFSLF